MNADEHTNHDNEQIDADGEPVLAFDVPGQAAQDHECFPACFPIDASELAIVYVSQKLHQAREEVPGIVILAKMAAVWTVQEAAVLNLP